MLKPSLEKNRSSTIYLCQEDKGVHSFPKDTSPKVNVIAQLEFELAYYNVAVQHVSHYATGITPGEFG